MIRTHKLKATCFFKWVHLDFVGGRKTPFWSAGSLFGVAQSPRFYRTKKDVESEILDGDSQSSGRIYDKTKRAAQAALLEYLHSTRNLQFTDAENMSKNSPHFLRKLLRKVDIEENIGPSISRFLRYHPINEFEPFFESLGLKPSEYRSFLPRDLMFLADDQLLLENYHVLCDYGISRNEIGKMYMKATEIFGYDYGVLELKLKAYEELGLDQSFMVKVLTRVPGLLIGDVNVHFVKVLEILRKVGTEFSWIEEHLSGKTFYSWSQLLTLLDLFSKIGYNEQQLGRLIKQQPGLLFEDSGKWTLLLIGFLLKFGYTMNQLSSLFLQFPETKVESFLSNLMRCFMVLTEVEMEPYEIGKIFHSHVLLLGSCTLKKTNSLLTGLNVGKKRLCDIILENPLKMKKWEMGSKLHSLPSSGEELRSQMLKTKFMSDLGLVESSEKMEKALKIFRGKGSELQERFDCIVESGLDKKDVCEMIKRSPQILNMKKDVIQMKIDFLVNDLGYPVSSLAIFPSYLNYTIQRVKLRLGMYNWLKEQGLAEPMLTLSTIIASSDKSFTRQYVKRHPRGPEIWQDLKKQIYSV